jgi:AbrB family looped-hinge helix DNA binding protein
MVMRLSSKGQIVLPKNIRAKLNLKSGDQFVAKIVDGTIVLEPAPVNVVAKLRGKYAGHDFIKDLEEEHRKEVENDGQILV